MPRVARVAAVVAVGAALVFAPAGAVAAGSATQQDLDDFEIESFDADLARRVAASRVVVAAAEGVAGVNRTPETATPAGVSPRTSA
ncbi:hypothetical protein [Pseudolysinimonas sp.]|uniref:hypothetical protein n=1 Tax=Pseudolysinimonas sp. TaxID=2680009 RepID=UPI00286C4E65|nr:hypothetical protein [Pseudolysinimonas sp.]